MKATDLPTKNDRRRKNKIVPHHKRLELIVGGLLSGADLGWSRTSQSGIVRGSRA